MAYISEKLPRRKLSLPRKFKTLESLVTELKFGKFGHFSVSIY